MDINIIVEGTSNGLTLDGIIGLATSTIAIFISIWTMKQTSKQFKEDKRLSIKPYLNYEKKELIEGGQLASNLAKQLQELKGYESINFLYKGIWGNYLGEEYYQFRLILHNIGLGHAIKCTIDRVYTKNNEENFRIFYPKKFLGSIELKEKLELKFNIRYSINTEHSKLIGTCFKSFEEYGEVNSKVYEESIKDIYMDIKYYDVLFNEYITTIHFKFANYLDNNNKLIDITIDDIGTEFSICYEDSEDKLIKLNNHVFKK